MANLVMRFVAPVAILVLLCGCNGPVQGLYPPRDVDAREIYVVSNHWHTGFALRADELSPKLQKLLPRFVEAQYIEFGWGDDHFYRSPNSTSGLATEALFASKGSVMHAAALDRDPESHYEEFLVDLYRVRISPEGERRLIAFIESSFDIGANGTAIELQPGFEPGSWFYRARGQYSLFHTCNQWTADGLRTTGFPISPFYAALAGNVGWQVRTLARNDQGEVLILHDGKPLAVAAQSTRDYNN